MSDVGLYAALEADLKSRIEALDLFADVLPSMSAADLATRDGIRKPAAGIVHTDSTEAGIARGVNVPQRWANVTFQVAVAFDDARGKVSSRPKAQEALEKIRGAVHFKRPTLATPCQLWLWQTETYPDEQPAGLLVAVANFYIPIMVGN